MQPSHNNPEGHRFHKERSPLPRAAYGCTATSPPGEIAGVAALFQGLEAMFSVLVQSGNDRLGPIKGYVSLIQDDNDDATNTRRWADKIMRNVRLMEDHFDLLNSYRIRGAVGVVETSWQRIVSSVMDRFASINVRGVPIEIANNTHGAFLQHEKIITRVLTHLVVNGYEGVGDGGKLFVTIEEIGSAPGCRRYRVSVADNGRGIERGDIALVWQPFFTTKHNHIGLGLSYVAATASILGMETELASSAGSGTTVTLVIPEQGG